MAMLLAETLGEAAYTERVKIYATDVDEDALKTARLALYTDKEVQNVPRPLRRSTSSAPTSGWRSQGPATHGDLRPQQPRLGRADLAPGPAGLPQHAHVLHGGDPGPDPASLPLRSARSRRARAREVGDDGLPPRDLHAGRPQEADLPQARGRAVSLQARIAGMANGDAMELPVPSDDRASRDAALELGPHPQIIVSRTGELSYANLPARGLFGISRGRFLRSVRRARDREPRSAVAARVRGGAA